MRINRFPKMMLLWKAKFEKDGLDAETALAFGWTAAVQFAIIKNRAPVGAKRKKSSTNAGYIKPTQDTWEFYPVKELPMKGIYFKRQKDGIYVRIGNKIENATKKAHHQLSIKFPKRDFLKIYFSTAKAIVDAISDWHKGWYKMWKKVRDADWATLEIYQNMQM